MVIVLDAKFINTWSVFLFANVLEAPPQAVQNFNIHRSEYLYTCQKWVTNSKSEPVLIAHVVSFNEPTCANA